MKVGDTPLIYWIFWTLIINLKLIINTLKYNSEVSLLGYLGNPLVFLMDEYNIQNKKIYFVSAGIRFCL